MYCFLLIEKSKSTFWRLEQRWDFQKKNPIVLSHSIYPSMSRNMRTRSVVSGDATTAFLWNSQGDHLRILQHSSPDDFARFRFSSPPSRFFRSCIIRMYIYIYIYIVHEYARVSKRVGGHRSVRSEINYVFDFYELIRGSIVFLCVRYYIVYAVETRPRLNTPSSTHLYTYIITGAYNRRRA